MTLQISGEKFLFCFSGVSFFCSLFLILFLYFFFFYIEEYRKPEQTKNHKHKIIITETEIFLTRNSLATVSLYLAGRPSLIPLDSRGRGWYNGPVAGYVTEGKGVRGQGPAQKHGKNMKNSPKKPLKKAEKTQKQVGEGLTSLLPDQKTNEKTKFQALKDNIMAMGEDDPTLKIGILLNKMKKMRSGSFVLSGRPFNALFNGNVQIIKNGDKTFITFLGQRTVLILKD